MATSSTNKQTLLIDRPLICVRSLAATTSPAGTVDPGTGSNGVLLVDCTANDGALIEAIWLIQRVAGNVTPVNLYLSNSGLALGVTATGSAADAHFIGRVAHAAAAPVGQQVFFNLPPLLAPVPHAGENINGAPPQFDGLRLQRGTALWAAAEATTPQAGASLIACQGGFY